MNIFVCFNYPICQKRHRFVKIFISMMFFFYFRIVTCYEVVEQTTLCCKHRLFNVKGSDQTASRVAGPTTLQLWFKSFESCFVRQSHTTVLQIHSSFCLTYNKQTCCLSTCLFHLYCLFSCCYSVIMFSNVLLEISHESNLFKSYHMHITKKGLNWSTRSVASIWWSILKETTIIKVNQSLQEQHKLQFSTL